MREGVSLNGTKTHFHAGRDYPNKMYVNQKVFVLHMNSVLTIRFPKDR